MEAKTIVNTMYANDKFSQWLGIQLVEIKKGEATLSMQIRSDMLNGFGIAHGGITYSLADSALAFASNSGGHKSVSINTSIAHVESLKEGDTIVAKAVCESDGNKIGHYRVEVRLTNNPEKIVAIFKGMVYKTAQEWLNLVSD